MSFVRNFGYNGASYTLDLTILVRVLPVLLSNRVVYALVGAHRERSYFCIESPSTTLFATGNKDKPGI